MLGNTETTSFNSKLDELTEYEEALKNKEKELLVMENN